MTPTTRIDTTAVNRLMDARQWLDFGQLRRVSGTGGGEYAGPCPKCGGRDRFHVQPDAESGPRWLCRKCSDRFQDGIALVMWLRGVGFVEAVELITGDRPVPAGTPQQDGGELAARPFSGPPSDDWQNAALAAVVDAARRLRRGWAWMESNANMEPETWPAPARLAHWLHTKRGLDWQTVDNAMLGYNPDWRQLLPPAGEQEKGYWLAPGVTIPAFAGPEHTLWYVNVRTFRRGMDKYRSATGSQLKTLYNANALMSADKAIIVEGELDCLLLDQHVGDVASVATMGSASTIADAGTRWSGYLDHIQELYLVMDADAAGSGAVARWLAERPHVKVISIPAGTLANGKPVKDITDYWRAGGDLRSWALDFLEA